MSGHNSDTSHLIEMESNKETKQKIAECFIGLVKRSDFEKVTVAAICDACGISRQSFYYHFRDKYDLVSWIHARDYDEEELRKGLDPGTGLKDMDRWRMLCSYYDANRDYYRKVFRYMGQNSLMDHLYRTGREMLTDYFDVSDWPEKEAGFIIDYFAPSIILSIRRWVIDPDPLPMDDFLARIKYCLDVMTEGTKVVQEYWEKPELS